MEGTGKLGWKEAIHLKREPISQPYTRGRHKRRGSVQKSTSPVSSTRQLRTSYVNSESGGPSRTLVHVPNMHGASDTSDSHGAPNLEHGNISQEEKSAYEERIKRLENVIEKMERQNTGTENRFRLTLRSDCIPEFCPENENLTAVKWLEKVDQLKGINGWDDITTIYHMQSRLTGMAKTWYHSLSSVNYTWTEWKSLIAKTFPDHVDFAKALRKMLDRLKLPSETMISYYFGKMELIRTCQLSAQQAVSCLIDGIPDVTMQNAARAGRYATPEAFFEEYLSMLRDETPTSSSFSRNEPPPRRSLKVDLRHSLSKVHQGQAKLEIQNVKCFNCKMKGHFQSQCTKPRVSCSKCHLLGHEADRCRVNTKDRMDRGNKDTGCAAVTIRESNANSLNLQREPTLVRLYGYAGGSVVVHSKVTIELEVDLATASVEALIVPDHIQNVPIIVGQPFINNSSITVLVRGDQIRLYNQNNITVDPIDEFI
ncbi:hypothetical protein NQ317_010180 [Molorchus minor]|uniref:CCHC-type domain-containing protein n=1 Tax=Molorchus minor TaxID=1323400 RepID=A0ABQ9JW82_9CUCU|nr:hypothetical protein NQ317_010180 [Molorchus minor]